MDQPALHGEALLKALVAVAVKVAGTRTVDGVLEAAGDGLKSVGLKMVLAQYRGPRVFLRYLNFAPGTEVGRNLPREHPPMLPGLEQAFQAGQPIFIEDIKAWASKLAAPPAIPNLLEAAVATGFGRFVVVPLIVSGKRWGGVALASAALEAADVPALSLFGAQLHSALEVAETIEALERRYKELEEVHAVATAATPDESSYRLLQTVAGATHADAASLHRYDRDTDELTMVGEPFGFQGGFPPHWRRFKKTGAPLPKVSVSRPASEFPSGVQVIASGYHHLATVFLSVDGRLAGLLTLARSADAPFSAAEVHTAEILGVQVSSSLERARLNAESGKQVRQLQLLYEMTSAGAVVGQINPVIDRLLAQMLDAFPVDGAAIHFIERTQFRLAGWTMREVVLTGPPTAAYLPIDDSSLIGQAVANRKTISGSAGSFPPWTATNLARLGGLSHLLATPLLVGERLVGTLSLVRKQDAPFSTSETRLAESCAVHIAVILEHVRLYDDLKKSYDDLAHTQAELVKHERLAALGELAAVMAHEVRNPLGVIFNALTTLKRQLALPGESELLLRIIGEEADRLNRIVGDLLDFARPYEALKKPIALEPILAGAIDTAVAAVPNSSARVVVQFPAELPRFQLDAHLVRQAFVNLVVNALQAMPKGGTVAVRALPEERDGQLWARIEVRDEGTGISAETAERIFEPFFTTKATGTGLGLAVVKRIIDAHRGEVTVQARPEGGTTFTVRLPGGSVPEAVERSDDDEDTQPPIALLLAPR